MADTCQDFSHLWNDNQEAREQDWVRSQHVADVLEDDRCPGVAAQRGVVFRCDLPKDHGGWAHCNSEHELIWE